MMFHLSPRATPLYTGLGTGAFVHPGPASKHSGPSLKKDIPAKVSKALWRKLCLLNVLDYCNDMVYFCLAFSTKVTRVCKSSKLQKNKTRCLKTATNGMVFIFLVAVQIHYTCSTCNKQSGLNYVDIDWSHYLMNQKKNCFQLTQKWKRQNVAVTYWLWHERLPEAYGRKSFYCVFTISG